MLLLISLVFAFALWITDVNIGNTAAAVMGRPCRGMSPGLAGILMALAWGAFYYLTH